MSKKTFTKEEINSLLANNNVANCTIKSITYSSEFKVNAIKQYEEGWMPREIFINSGFNLLVLGKVHPKDCLKRWRNIVRTKGINSLKKEMRGHGGGRPKTKNLSDKEKIEYLETKVAYLKAENDFLAKLRAQRKAE